MPADGFYRHIYQAAEQHGHQRRRATYFNCSKSTYLLSEIVQEPGNRVIYFLQDGPNRSFVREELMLIPEDFRAASLLEKTLNRV